VVPAAQSVDCVSIFARTVGLAAQVLQAAMGHDALDPFSRKLHMAGDTAACRLSLWCAVRAALFWGCRRRSRVRQAVTRLRALGGTPVAVDFTPLAQAAALLYESALVAERYAAIRPSSTRMKPM
jgi:allophanate hydrolase